MSGILANVLGKGVILPPPVPVYGGTIERVIEELESEHAGTENQSPPERPANLQGTSNSNAAVKKCFSYQLFQRFKQKQVGDPSLRYFPGENVVAENQGDVFLSDLEAFAMRDEDSRLMSGTVERVYPEMSGQAHHSSIYAWDESQGVSAPGYGTFVEGPTTSNLGGQSLGMHIIVRDDSSLSSVETDESPSEIVKDVKSVAGDYCKRSKRSVDAGICQLMSATVDEYSKAEMDLFKTWLTMNDRFHYFARTIPDIDSANRLDLMRYEFEKARVYFLRAQLGLLMDNIGVQEFIRQTNIYLFTTVKMSLHHMGKFIIGKAGAAMSEKLEKALELGLKVTKDLSALHSRLKCIVGSFIEGWKQDMNSDVNFVNYMKKLKQLVDKITFMHSSSTIKFSVKDRALSDNVLSSTVNATNLLDRCQQKGPFRSGIVRVDEVECNYLNQCPNWMNTSSEELVADPICNSCERLNTSVALTNLDADVMAICNTTIAMGRFHANGDCQAVCVQFITDRTKSKIKVIGLNHMMESDTVVHSFSVANYSVQQTYFESRLYPFYTAVSPIKSIPGVKHPIAVIDRNNDGFDDILYLIYTEPRVKYFNIGATAEADRALYANRDTLTYLTTKEYNCLSMNGVIPKGTWRKGSMCS